MTLLYGILATVFSVICVFMILLILIQKGRGGGLSSAFGGAGGNTAFGSKTGDVLTWVTSIVFVIFVLLSMSLIWTADAVDARPTAVRTEPAPDDPAVVDDELIDEDDAPEGAEPTDASLPETSPRDELITDDPIEAPAD